MKLENGIKPVTISVVYATDKNYLFYTCVSITSLAETAKKGTFYNVYILTEEEFSDEEKLFDKLEKTFSNLKIYQITVVSAFLPKVHIVNQHISKAAFYRLLICDYVNEDKCIYLDSDTAVTEDLEELWNYDLTDYYIGGCRDIWIDMLTREEQEKRRRETNIPSMDEYINSGVLIMNLKKIRQDKIDKKFREHMNYKYNYEDQDILNVCCYHHILRLPEKWNSFTAVMAYDRELLEAGISKKILCQFKPISGIIHYIEQECRPWESFSAWNNWFWWKKASRWSDTQIYQKIHQKVVIEEKKRRWIEWLKLIEEYEQIVIWGYGKNSMDLCQWMLNNTEKKKIRFCDRDVKKQGQEFQGILVESPEDIVKDKKEQLYLIMCKKWKNEIKDFLMKFDVSEEKIKVFFVKDQMFYRILDERFYDIEIDEIFQKENIEVTQEKRLDELQYHKEWTTRYYLDRWIFKEK